MQNTRPLLALLASSILLFALGYVFTHSYDFSVCSYSNLDGVVTKDVSCNKFFERLGDPMFYGFGALVVVFLALLMFPQAFNAWKKFAIWFVPLATFLFIIWPEPQFGMGIGAIVIGPPLEIAFQWISGFYILVSLAIIALSEFKRRKH